MEGRAGAAADRGGGCDDRADTSSYNTVPDGTAASAPPHPPAAHRVQWRPVAGRAVRGTFPLRVGLGIARVNGTYASFAVS